MIIVTLLFNIMFTNIKNIKYLMEENLETDYKMYKECINKTNLIKCGKNKSIVQKHKKPHTKYRKQFILSSTECKLLSDTRCNNKYSLILVGIGSGPDYFYERHVYRFYYSKYKFLRYYFFMGSSDNKYINKKLYEENKIYNDIIIFSFISSYYNLTSQIICTLNWISSYCNGYKWYIHHTSDTYLNIKRIYSFLKNYRECNCIIGYITKNAKVNRNKNSEFYIPYHIINSTFYPPYPNGPGYFVHQSAITEIIQKINISNPKIWIDDVYIGIVIENTNTTLINLKEYFHMGGNIYITNVNNYFLVHNLSPSEIYYIEKSSIEKMIIF